jgi:hypothetical protein
MNPRGPTDPNGRVNPARQNVGQGTCAPARPTGSTRRAGRPIHRNDHRPDADVAGQYVHRDRHRPARAGHRCSAAVRHLAPRRTRAPYRCSGVPCHARGSPRYRDPRPGLARLRDPGWGRGQYYAPHHLFQGDHNDVSRSHRTWIRLPNPAPTVVSRRSGHQIHRARRHSSAQQAPDVRRILSGRYRLSAHPARTGAWSPADAPPRTAVLCFRADPSPIPGLRIHGALNRTLDPSTRADLSLIPDRSTRGDLNRIPDPHSHGDPSLNLDPSTHVDLSLIPGRSTRGGPNRIPGPSIRADLNRIPDPHSHGALNRTLDPSTHVDLSLIPGRSIRGDLNLNLGLSIRGDLNRIPDLRSRAYLNQSVVRGLILGLCWRAGRGRAAVLCSGAILNPAYVPWCRDGSDRILVSHRVAGPCPASDQRSSAGRANVMSCRVVRPACPLTLRRPPQSSLPGAGYRHTQKCKEGRPILLGDPPKWYVRRCPTLPRPLGRSTIGAEGLNFRVRNGSGCFPFAMTAVTLWRYDQAPGGLAVSREPHSGREA